MIPTRSMFHFHLKGANNNIIAGLGATMKGTAHNERREIVAILLARVVERKRSFPFSLILVASKIKR